MHRWGHFLVIAGRQPGGDSTVGQKTREPVWDARGTVPGEAAHSGPSETLLRGDRVRVR